MYKILDAHSDIWNDVVNRRMRGEKNVIVNHHLEKLRSGKIFSGIFVVWVDTPFDNPAKRFWQTVHAMTEELEENKKVLRVVQHYDDFMTAESNGQFPIVLGLEGFDGLEAKDSAIQKLYDLGFRHGSLTWNTANAFGTGVKGNPALGLTDLGVDAVKRMEALGMVVDVSHANESTFWDVVRLSERPIVASHSNCRALCDVPRNLTDGQIRAVAASGGAVGLVAYPDFISRTPSKQTLRKYCDHIDHVVNVAGIDHVGLGFDFVDYLEEEAISSFSGESSYTEGLENASVAYRVVEVLKDRGYDKNSIAKVCSGNFMRVMKQVIG